MRLPALAAIALMATVAVATFVRADEEKAPDLAARCDAVDWDGPRENDHLPAGLRAIAKELTSKGPSALAEIEEALPRSVNLRRTAPDVLYHWPSDKTRALLVKQLADPDEQAAHHAAWALGLVGGVEVVEPMLAAARKPKGVVRDQVVGALVALGATDRAYDVIAMALADRGYWSRVPALVALEHFTVADKLDDAIARVEKLAESDPDARVKDAAARTLRVLRARK
jgi:HEAT repeat protein